MKLVSYKFNSDSVHLLFVAKRRSSTGGGNISRHAVFLIQFVIFYCGSQTQVYD